MQDAAILASVIIPHFNDVVRLRKCLTALAPQVVDAPVEVIVCDNASSQDLSEVQAAFSWVRFLHEPTPGAAAARNRGVAESRGEWLFFIDADCVAADDWIAVALSRVRPGRVIGGRVTVFDETPPPRSGAEAFEHVFAFNFKLYIEKYHYSGAGNMLVSRTVFDHVGPFDGSRSEDMDWGQRAHAVGYPIDYVPELVVGHPTRQDWTALEKKWRRITSEMYFANGTRPVRRLIWGLRSMALIASIAPHSLKVLRHPGLSRRDRAAAFGVLVRLRVLRAGWTLRQAFLGETPINQLKMVPPVENAPR
jgi:glycosyltransferase involved in cell wall biosynthesis